MRRKKKKSGICQHAGQEVPVVCLQLFVLYLWSSTMRFVRLVSFHNNPILPLKSIAAIATSTNILGGFESRTPAALALGRCDVVVLADVVGADVVADVVADVIVAN